MNRRILMGVVILASMGMLAAFFVNMISFSAMNSEEKAVLIYKRLAGQGVSVDDAIIQQMVPLLNSGNIRGAAKLVIDQDAGFYNLTLRDYFARMSARDELVTNTLNDFIATGIGAVRDDVDARQLLTGNFSYRNVAGEANIRANILESNIHYDNFRTSNLKTSLTRFEPQQLLDVNGAVVANPDSAGLLTSRAFLAAHAVAGTNRRLVEYSFREFLCLPIEQWSDATAPDNYIGQDVERFPEGSNQKFQSNCRACHAPMDGMRPAFAYVTFDNNIVRHSLINRNNLFNTNTGIAIKYLPTGANQKFPAGFAPVDTSFRNYAITGANASYFGWDPVKLRGSGINQFGDMIASSRSYSRCLVRRAFREVCRREAADVDKPGIDAVTSEFMAGGYKLKTVFEALVARPECLGN